MAARIVVAQDLLFSNSSAVELTYVKVREFVGLTRAAKLTSNDASYVWLARKLGAELVTLDRELGLAAKS